MIESLLLDWHFSMMMLLRKSLLVLDWLLGGVVVCLMHLTVDCWNVFLMLRLSDVLVLDSWSYRLMNGGVMLATLAASKC